MEKELTKTKYSVLYVDDEESNLRIFKNTFRFDYKVLTAHSGNEGLRVLREKDIDLIITDQRMPKMTGVQFLEKAIKEYPDPNRILLTAFSDYKVLQQAVNSGRIFQYVEKPWKEEKFKPIIDAALEAYTLKEDNKRLTKELKDKAKALMKSEQRTRLLKEIAIAANEAVNPKEALKVTLDGVCNFTRWPVGHVYLPADDGTKDLVPTKLWHLDEPRQFKEFKKVTEQTRFAPGIGLPGRVFSSNKPAWIIDVTKDPNFPRAKLAKNLGVRGAFGFPVLTEEGVEAVLEFFSKEAQPPDETLLEIMAKIGTQIGIVVERKRAIEELVKYREHLEEMVKERTTELKKANYKIEQSLDELKQAQAKLIQTEKMASIGLLTAGLAHEINNPLNFINIGTAGLEKDLKILLQIMDKYQELEKAPQSTGVLKDIAKLKEKIDFEYLMDNIPETLKDIRLGVHRSAEIIKSLTNFSRIDAEDPVMTDIHRGLDATLLLLQSKIKDRVTIIKDYDGSIEGVMCYPSQLNQVFMNIILNAIQAVGDQGTLTITTSKHKNHIDISIKDSGPGISAENIGKIFDPFFTTKDVGDGTGLGLSITHGIIEKHEGKIEVKSEEGVGTEFVITLPISSS